MPDLEVPVRRIIGIVLGMGVVIIVAGISVSALLDHWGLPPGGETGSPALIAPIPPPQLQTAPQSGRPASQSADRNDASLEFQQRLGSRLPAHLELVDADGRSAELTAAHDPRPTVLVPAYFRCNTLCGTVAHGAIEALADTGLPSSSWRLRVVSFDPRDSPRDALALQHVYAGYADYARPAVYAAPARADVGLLVGDAGATRALATAIGFDGLVDEGSSAANTGPNFAHATGLVVLTPQGTVSRYFFGVRFDPRELRLALVEASNDHIGSLTDRLVLACSHFDPALGRHDAAVMLLVRGVGVTLVVALAGFAWRHRGDRGPGDDGRPAPGEPPLRKAPR